MTTAPVLQHPDVALPFTLYCDASTVAVGGVLSQTNSEGEERPVKFVSKALNSAQLKYSVGELECLAVVTMIRACK